MLPSIIYRLKKIHLWFPFHPTRKEDAFLSHFKNSPLKFQWTFLLVLKAHLLLEVCELFFVFPSVLPVFKKLTQIDEEVCEENSKISYQSPEEKAKSWKIKRYFCPSVFIEQRKWLTKDNTISARVITFMSLTQFSSCMYIAYTKKFKE